MTWIWDGRSTKIVSRSTDDKGNVQPDRAAINRTRWEQTRCFTTTRSRPGASTQKGKFAMFSHKLCVLQNCPRQLLATHRRLPMNSVVRLRQMRSTFGTSMSGPTARACRKAAEQWRRGKPVFEDNCSGCHGAAARMASRTAWLAARARSPPESPQDCRKFLALCDDVVRLHSPGDALPGPRSLSVDETYAVAAYILNLNGILPEDGKLNKETLPQIKMPNRNGFIPEPEFRNITNSR